MSTQQTPLHKPERKDIYKDSLTDELYQIIYIDDQVVVLRGSSPERSERNKHRITTRKDFDAGIEQGKFKHQPDSSLDMLSFEKQDWSEVNTIGEKTAENLLEAGYETNLDIQQAEDGDLTDVAGVGNAGAENLREFAE